jgi:hypothetical protein
MIGKRRLPSRPCLGRCSSKYSFLFRRPRFLNPLLSPIHQIPLQNINPTILLRRLILQTPFIHLKTSLPTNDLRQPRKTNHLPHIPSKSPPRRPRIIPCHKIPRHNFPYSQHPSHTTPRSRKSSKLHWSRIPVSVHHGLISPFFGDVFTTPPCMDDSRRIKLILIP